MVSESSGLLHQIERYLREVTAEETFSECNVTGTALLECNEIESLIGRMLKGTNKLTALEVSRMQSTIRSTRNKLTGK